MRNRRPKQLSEFDRARFLEIAHGFCREINGMSAKVAPTGDDYRALTALNREVLAAVQRLTGEQAPWILPAPGSSSPDCKGG